MAKGPKYYVVWEGFQKGVFSSWNECKKQIEGFSGAKYKAFETLDAAKEAYRKNYWECVSKKSGGTLRKSQALPSAIIADSLAVDAACGGNPGVLEYQGVRTFDKQHIFHRKFPVGTNNIGEFLAIVHGLSYLKKNNLPQPIYSDSQNGISWVKQKKCKTKLPRTPETEELFQYIERAELWLKNNTWTTEILKWDTENWGEIPADFGRK